MNYQEKTYHDFNPNDFGNLNNTIFGLPHPKEDAYIHILSAPWDVTNSYVDGTSLAPPDIFEASFQVDLYDPAFEDKWKRGYYFLPYNKKILAKNIQHRRLAKLFIEALMKGKRPDKNPSMKKQMNDINLACHEMNEWVYQETQKTLQTGKRSILLGGDHSTPFGHLRAIAEYEQKEIGVLVIDAHLDMRVAYEYFTYSHASIIWNILENFPGIKHLTQVGIRDYCEDEKNYALSQKGRVNVFYNLEMKKRMFEGVSWKKIVQRIIDSLPEKDIYISIDIDGLQPQYCPHTGTPVAGGLDIDELFYLLEKLHEKKKRIIGADLVEVGHSKDKWDANVGARVLYKLCNLIS